MRYGEGDRESEYVEDRRGEGGGTFGSGLGGIPIPIGGGGLSITSLLVIGAVCLMLGINPLELLGGLGGMPNLPRSEPFPSRRSVNDIPGLPGQKGVEPQSEAMTHFV